MKKKMMLAAILVITSLMLSTLSVVAAPPTDKGNPPGNSHAQKTQMPQAKPDDHGKPDHSNAAKGKPQHFKGVVAEVAADHLTLTLADGSAMIFAVTADTQVKIPTLKNATVEQITVGSQAMVTGKAAEDGTFTAQKIMTIPGKPVHIHRVGVVTEYTAGVSITILAKDGANYTFLLAPNAKILPAARADKLVVGAKVTIISRRDPINGPLTAQGVVVHPDAATGDDDNGGEAPNPTETIVPTETVTPTEDAQ